MTLIYYFKKKQLVFYSLFIIAIAYWTYTPILKLYFNMDDVWIMSSSLNFKNIIFFGNSNGNAASVLSRPLTFLYGRMYYELFGLDKAIIGHLMNITAHVINSFLVYLICLKLTKSKSISFLSLLIFLLHSTNYFVLSGITYISELFMTLFMFLSFYFYMMFIENRRSIFYAFSFASFFVSLGWKETAIIVPILLVVFLLVFNKCSVKFKYMLGAPIHLIPYFIILGIYLVYRIWILGIPEYGDYRPIFDICFLISRMFFYFKLSMQMIDYSLLRSSFSRNTVLFFLFITILTGLVLGLIKHSKVCLYCLFLWALPIICILPFNNNQPLYLYSSLMGFAIIFSTAIVLFIKLVAKNIKIKPKNTICYAMACFFALNLGHINKNNMPTAFSGKYQIFIGQFAKNLIGDMKEIYPKIEKGSLIIFLNTQNNNMWSPEFVKYFKLAYDDLSLRIKMDAYDDIESLIKNNGIRKDLYILKYYNNHFYDISNYFYKKGFRYNDIEYVLPLLTEETIEYKSFLNFEEKININQIACGWFIGENMKDGKGRIVDPWMSDFGRVFLKVEKSKKYMIIKGYAPFSNKISVHINGSLLKNLDLEKEQLFQIKEEISTLVLDKNFLAVDIRVDNAVIPAQINKKNKDERKIGIIIKYIGIATE